MLWLGVTVSLGFPAGKNTHVNDMNLPPDLSVRP